MTMTITTEALDETLDGYVACQVWSGLDYSDDAEGGDCRQLDENYDVEDVTPEAMAAMRETIADFLIANWEDCLEYVRECEAGGRIGYNGVDGSPWAWLGHDFSLTRNGHGAGFWDRGLGDLGERLTEACRPYGEEYLFPNADGGLDVG